MRSDGPVRSPWIRSTRRVREAERSWVCCSASSDASRAWSGRLRPRRSRARCSRSRSPRRCSARPTSSDGRRPGPGPGPQRLRRRARRARLRPGCAPYDAAAGRRAGRHGRRARRRAGLLRSSATVDGRASSAIADARHRHLPGPQRRRRRPTAVGGRVAPASTRPRAAARRGRRRRRHLPGRPAARARGRRHGRAGLTGRHAVDEQVLHLHAPVTVIGRGTEADMRLHRHRASPASTPRSVLDGGERHRSTTSARPTAPLVNGAPVSRQALADGDVIRHRRTRCWSSGRTALTRR